MSHASLFAYPKQDLIAGMVVFLVALPLCLGIAIASGAPPVSGLVAGICGGLIVPWISRSPLSVSGPAAGLTSIVLAAITDLGGMSPFLTAVMIAGVLQFGLGALRAGRFAALVPSSVIKGMLAAIGITIIWKQIPVAFGVEGGLMDLGGGIHVGATLITLASLVILYGVKRTPLARYSVLSPALMVVLVASGLAVLFKGTTYALTDAQFVRVPLGGFTALAAAVPRPDFAAFALPAVWITAFTIAIVASIETLLSLQAVDRLDPMRRTSPPDQELLAQGTANLFSGFLGGLPLTAVIVRSGANVAAGGRDRLSSIVHGVLLLVAVLFFGTLINQIPLAALAAVLIQVGLNLCKPALFRLQARLGYTQLMPFAITIAAVLATDLLIGVIIGIVVGILFVLFQNSKGAVITSREPNGALLVRFRRDGTFVSKPGILKTLEQIPDGEKVVIDGTGEYIDHDVKEMISTFLQGAPRRDIIVSIVGIDLTLASAGSGH